MRSVTCTRSVNGKDACRCNAVTITVKLYSCKCIWFLLFVVLLLLLLSLLPLLLLVASLCRVFRKDMHALPFLAPKQMPRTTCSRKAISYNGTCSAFVYTICIRMFHSIYKSMHKFPKVVVEFFEFFFFFFFVFFLLSRKVMLRIFRTFPVCRHYFHTLAIVWHNSLHQHQLRRSFVSDVRLFCIQP